MVNSERWALPAGLGAVCQQSRPDAANALILNTKFIFWACNGNSSPATLIVCRKERLMISEDFKRQLQGYGLTTAPILYRMPDHPSFLQTFVWQEDNLCPAVPQLFRFL